MQKQQRKSARSKSKKGKGSTGKRKAMRHYDDAEDVLGGSDWHRSQPPEDQRIALEDMKTVLGFPVQCVNDLPCFGFPEPSFTIEGKPFYDRLKVFKWLCDEFGWEGYVNMLEEVRALKA